MTYEEERDVLLKEAYMNIEIPNDVDVLADINRSADRIRNSTPKKPLFLKDFINLLVRD